MSIFSERVKPRDQLDIFKNIKVQKNNKSIKNAINTTAHTVNRDNENSERNCNDSPELKQVKKSFKNKVKSQATNNSLNQQNLSYLKIDIIDQEKQKSSTIDATISNQPQTPQQLYDQSRWQTNEKSLNDLSQRLKLGVVQREQIKRQVDREVND